MDRRRRENEGSGQAEAEEINRPVKIIRLRRRGRQTCQSAELE